MDDLSDLHPTNGRSLSSIASNAFDMMMKFYGDQDNCLTVKYSFNYQVTKNLILSNINHIRAWLWSPPAECLIMIMMIVMIVMIITNIMVTIIIAELGCGRLLLSIASDDDYEDNNGYDYDKDDDNEKISVPGYGLPLLSV